MRCCPWLEARGHCNRSAASFAAANLPAWLEACGRNGLHHERANEELGFSCQFQFGHIRQCRACGCVSRRAFAFGPSLSSNSSKEARDARPSPVIRLVLEQSRAQSKCAVEGVSQGKQAARCAPNISTPRESKPSAADSQQQKPASCVCDPWRDLGLDRVARMFRHWGGHRWIPLEANFID